MTSVGPMWLSRAIARGKRLWGFDDSERGVLVDATTNIPELQALVARAQRRSEFGGVWLVEAAVRELNEMYSLVEALMDGTRVSDRRSALTIARARGSGRA